MGRVTLIAAITSTSTARLSNIAICILKIIKGHSEPTLTSKTELFAKTINDKILLTSFTKCSIFNISLGFENTHEDSTFFTHVIRIPTPAGNSIFKVNNRNTRKRCEICSKLTIKTSEWNHRRYSSVFIINFEHILHLDLVFLLSNLSR